MFKSRRMLKRSAALCLTLLLLFSLLLICGEEPPSDVPQETLIDLVKGGTSDYMLVVPVNAEDYEYYAASELKKYFEAATGITLEIKEDDKVIYDDDSSLIILGESAFLSTAGISVPRDLGECGFIVKRVNGNVFLCGGGDIGTLYAAYEFLHWQFGFEVYSLYEIAFDKGVSDKKLLNFDISDKPDIPYRQAYSEKYYKYSKNAHLLRLNVYGEVFIYTGGQPWHNTFRYLPKHIYQSSHPKWYTESGTQLHYTARGDSAELELMRREIINKMKDYIDADFEKGNYYEIISFMHEDGDGWHWAEDSSMDSWKAAYGTAYPTATLIHFLNPIAREIKQYMQEKHGGRKMDIITFAYHATEEPPVKETSPGSGKWVPIDDSVVLEDNIIILYAPITAKYTESFDDEANAKYKEIIEKWSVLTNSISFWTYSTYFNNRFMFYDSFGSMQDLFRLIKENNAVFSFYESYYLDNDMAFSALKAYLAAKLQWNVDADISKLTDDFFDNYYKEAASGMKNLFNSLRTHYASILKEDDLLLGSYRDILSNVFQGAAIAHAVYWPLSVIDEFLSKIDAIYQSIEPLKYTDNERYLIIQDRICLESLMFRYLKILNYSDEMDLAEEKQKFLDDCQKYNVTLKVDVKIENIFS